MTAASDGVLPLLASNDPRLRVAARPYGVGDPSLDADARALVATLGAQRRQHGFGRALAAPQVGIDRRLVAVDLGAGPFVLVDPSIDARSDDTFVVWDDCFSVPDCIVRVRRHRAITVGYSDTRGRRRRWDVTAPDLSELLQHEIDHLDGVLMTDRADGADAVRPSTDRAALIDAARQAHRLSLARIREARSQIDAVFLDTPQFESATLSRRLGIAATLKVESLNPIGSFKGRGADFFLRCRRGRRGALACASAGNFGQALAYGCARDGIALTVFAATTANPLKLERMRALGADVRLHGDDFDGAKTAARAWAASNGAEMVEDGLQPEISEGAGTIALELLADDPAFDAIAIPLGNGALVNGMARWIKAAAPATRVVGICSRGANAMAQSFRNGRGGAIVENARTDTIADGIAVRSPIAAAVDDMHGIVDDVIEVDDDAIIDAMRLLHEHTGLVIEPAGAVGIAAMLDVPARFGERAACVLSGGNVSPTQIATWLHR